jgi:hypothetical protein
MFSELMPLRHQLTLKLHKDRNSKLPGILRGRSWTPRKMNIVDFKKSCSKNDRVIRRRTNIQFFPACPGQADAF